MIPTYQLKDEDLTKIHNGICAVHNVIARLRGTIHPDLLAELSQASDLLTDGIDEVRQHSDEISNINYRYASRVGEQNDMQFTWSIQHVTDFGLSPEWATDGRRLPTKMAYRGHKVPLTHCDYLSLWRAAEKLMILSKTHHFYIEGFNIDPTDQTTLLLSTGS